MTKTDRNATMKQIDNLTAILAGKEIDGVRLGDRGVTAEWVKATRDQLAKNINGSH